QGSPDYASAIVNANAAPDARLEQEEFERFRVLEPEVVQVEDGFELLSNVGIGPGVVNKDSGIDEVGLAFKFAAAQTREQAVTTDQSHCGLSEPDFLAVPEAESSTRKFGKIKNRVKSSCSTVKWVLIAGRPKERPAYPKPIPILGKFD